LRPQLAPCGCFLTVSIVVASRRLTLICNAPWRVTDKALILSPFKETEMMKGHLRTLVLFQAGLLIFHLRS
jgi:hypothetical protein